MALLSVVVAAAAAAPCRKIRSIRGEKQSHYTMQPTKVCILDPQIGSLSSLAKEKDNTFQNSHYDIHFGGLHKALSSLSN